MSTNQGGITETTRENGLTSSSSDGAASYFEWFVVAIGVVGTAANGVVLYALVASKQHKKHELIVNQNALDLYSSLLLVVIYGLKLSNIDLSGSLGYWLCMFLYNESLLYSGVRASWVNLMFIFIERYLKVVHSVWSKKKLRKWMTYVAIACTWISGLIQEMVVVFKGSAVIGGVCYTFIMLKNPKSRMAIALYYILSTYVIVLLISVFCYGKILMVIRRQARVMASHNAGGSNTAQARSDKIQTNVVKTMILVCVFYAIPWLPEKTFVVISSLDISVTFVNIGFYVAVFLGFLYICTDLTVIATERCV